MQKYTMILHVFFHLLITLAEGFFFAGSKGKTWVSTYGILSSVTKSSEYIARNLVMYGNKIYIKKYISGKEHLQMHVKGATGFFWISKVSPETFEILARF
mgnify:CR=1 FL=1